MNYDTSMLIRLNKQDKQFLREVATGLQRSQADTIRLLVRSAATAMREQSSDVKEQNQTQNEPAS